MIQEKLIRWLQTQLGDKPAIIGLSGGVDSAVVAYVLAQAIPPDRIYGIFMPSETNDPSDHDDAAAIATQLKIHYEIILIDPLIQAFQKASDSFEQSMAEANLKARIRMSILYGKANAVDGMVVGTGNKSELMTGYFTKYGDGGVDLLPLGNLYKTQVWELARELGVPETIITKAPSAGLWPGQTDEVELGLSYHELDVILQAMERKADLTVFSHDKVQRVMMLRERAAHKLVPAMIASLT